MAARAGRYLPEYRERLVELARSGCGPGSPIREFELSEPTIRNWLGQADVDEGFRSDGPTTELRRLDGERCRGAGIARSMGSVGDAHRNALCESFFTTPECELVRRRSLRTASEARHEAFGFIEGFHNTRRLHSALGYESPADYESLHAA